MKKILLFLLITTLAYAAFEEYNEYDEVSLEKNPFSHIKDKVKDKVHDVKDKVKDKVHDVKDKVKDKVHEVKDKVKDKVVDPLKQIKDKLKGKHPFEEIKGRIKELQKHMKNKKISLKEIQRFLKGKPLEMFKKLSQHVQNGIHWLKVNGYWEPLKGVVKTVGKVAATSLCSAYLSPMICGPAIGFLFDAYINKL